jgi:hypothetical protein
LREIRSCKKHDARPHRCGCRVRMSEIAAARVSLSATDVVKKRSPKKRIAHSISQPNIAYHVIYPACLAFP